MGGPGLRLMSMLAQSGHSLARSSIRTVKSRSKSGRFSIASNIASMLRCAVRRWHSEPDQESLMFRPSSPARSASPPTRPPRDPTRQGLERGGSLRDPRRRAPRPPRIDPRRTRCPRHRARPQAGRPRPRLAAALKQLNPWLSDDNLHKAVRTVTDVQARRPHRGEREALHTTDLRHRPGAGPRRRQEEPPCPLLRLRRSRPTTSSSSRAQFKVQGKKKTSARRDAVRQRHPARDHRVQEPDARRGVEGRGHRPVLAVPGDGGAIPRPGPPKLFETIQLLVATCGQAAVYGTVAHAASLLRRVEDALPARPWPT